MGPVGRKYRHEVFGRDHSKEAFEIVFKIGLVTHSLGQVSIEIFWKVESCVQVIDLCPIIGLFDEYDVIVPHDEGLFFCGLLAPKWNCLLLVGDEDCLASRENFFRVIPRIFFAEFPHVFLAIARTVDTLVLFH